MRALTLGLAVSAAAIAGCPQPAPYFDDELGLTAEPVAPGELAGTFGLKMQITTQTNLPVIGLVTGGGDTYLLVQRSWDEATQRYRQTQQVCGGRIVSETSTSTLPIESWQSVPAEPPSTLTINDEEGFFALEGHLELWGLEREAFEDPYGDALPVDHIEALEAPHAGRIVDMDDDGQPGMTIFVDGLVTGDFYFIQRKISSITGVVLGPDRIVGLNDTSFKQIILGASDGPVQQGFPQMPHPDPKQSWTEEIRLADDADCDEVLQAIEDETISRFAPF
jgi:hypothetical protein